MKEQKKISLKVLDGQTEFAEDELQNIAEFFNKISKPLFYLLLIAAVGYFGNQFYNDAKLKASKDGAAQFQIVHETYNELLGVKQNDPANQEKIAQITTRLNEQIKVLGDKSKPYSQLAGLYSTLVAEGKVDSNEVLKLFTE